jgi:hypothetical protein
MLVRVRAPDVAPGPFVSLAHEDVCTPRSKCLDDLKPVGVLARPARQIEDLPRILVGVFNVLCLAARPLSAIASICSLPFEPIVLAGAGKGEDVAWLAFQDGGLGWGTVCRSSGQIEQAGRVGAGLIVV